jgi:fibronectin type 3 domain-containing protein
MAVTNPSVLTATAVAKNKITLHWTNGHSYNGGAYVSVTVQRKVSGGQWADLTPHPHLPGTATSYSDMTVADGTKYYYRVNAEAWEEPDSSGPTGYSNEANATTPLPAPGGLGGSSNAGGTEADLGWIDNSQNEASFKVYMDGVLIETTAANATSYTKTGLVPGSTHVFTVKAYNAAAGYSPASNSFELMMADPPAKPTNLVVIPTGTTTTRANFKDNADNEVDFHIERSETSASAGFSQIGTVGKNVTTYPDTGLTSNKGYWYRVRAHNASGYSGYSNVYYVVTLAAVAAPTNLVVKAAKVGGSYGVECIFADNSELEDSHILERKTGAGAYGVLATLAPNQTYYHDATAAAGSTYTYKIRAKQGAATYSDYSNEAAITVPGAPAAPAALTVTEYQDEWAILSWPLSLGEEGYFIKQSVDNGGTYVEVMRVGAGISSMRITGLLPATHYHWTVQAYSGAGDSAATGASQTTRAARVPSKFEKLLRKADPAIVFRAKANPLVRIGGWALTAGKTYTYEAAYNEGGTALVGLYENGVALLVKTSIATVEATAGTYWHDVSNSKVYVHASDGDDPINYLMMGSFWMYFTTGKTAWFDGNRYLPLLPADGIPDQTQAVESFWEGGFSVSSGTVSFLNPYLYREYFWDKKWEKYRWLNRRILIDAGGEGFAHSEFMPVIAGTINSKSWSKARVSFALRDLRDGIHRTVPIYRYSITEFPGMDENLAGQVRPEAYGPVVGAPANRIDTTNKIFEFNRGRVKTVSVTLNGKTLTAGTNYFVDYQQGRLTLARSLGYSTSDILLVDYTGGVNLADEAPLSNGAEAFRGFLTSCLTLTDADLDLYSIYETKYARTATIGLYFGTETESQDVIRKIEQSLGATSYQTNDGKIGLRAVQTAASSDSKYVAAGRVFDLTGSKTLANIFSAVDVFFAGSPDGKTWSSVTKMIGRAGWEHGAQKVLSIYTVLTDAADADDLGALVVSLLEAPQYPFEVDRVLYLAMPGDVAYLSVDRFPSLSGQASELPVRLTNVSKRISSGRTALIAEVV